MPLGGCSFQYLWKEKDWFEKNRRIFHVVHRIFFHIFKMPFFLECYYQILQNYLSNRLMTTKVFLLKYLFTWFASSLSFRTLTILNKILTSYEWSKTKEFEKLTSYRVNSCFEQLWSSPLLWLIWKHLNL